MRTDLIIVLLGAPGSGKGTQAQMLAKRYNIPHISTGDIFRYNIKNETSLGIEAKMYIDKGLLVPDILTCNIVNDRVQQDDCKNGFILDGFPRTLFQADNLNDWLKINNRKISWVINIDVSDQIVIKRLSGRRMCSNGHIYHMDYNRPKVEGICDECNEKLFIRDDDKPETIKSRLIAYHKITKPLEDYYSKSRLLVNIDGNDTPEAIFDKINLVV